MRHLITAFFAMAFLFLGNEATGQSVEVYAGYKRAGVDLMWFKNFKDKNDQRSPLLFFSRNRASTDYNNAPTAFGSTNAVSYNFKKGIGIVAVGSFLNAGFTPKAGVQFVNIKGNLLFFGWLVADLKKEGNLDLFGMLRWQPNINAHWRLFSQAELFSVNHPASGRWNLTQRVRLGARHRAWAAGGMADFNQAETSYWVTTRNIGGFLRYEF